MTGSVKYGGPSDRMLNPEESKATATLMVSVQHSGIGWQVKFFAKYAGWKLVATQYIANLLKLSDIDK